MGLILITNILLTQGKKCSSSIHLDKRERTELTEVKVQIELNVTKAWLK